MSKGGKIVIFVIAIIVIGMIGAILKEAGAGAVYSVGALALIGLYYALFSKKEKDDENKDQTDITLKK